jgi:hypothetical protein
MMLSAGAISNLRDQAFAQAERPHKAPKFGGAGDKSEKLFSFCEYRSEN